MEDTEAGGIQSIIDYRSRLQKFVGVKRHLIVAPSKKIQAGLKTTSLGYTNTQVVIHDQFTGGRWVILSTSTTTALQEVLSHCHMFKSSA
jgi:glutaredoxin-related protein